MTKEQIENAIVNKKLPTDHISNPSQVVFGSIFLFGPLLLLAFTSASITRNQVVTCLICSVVIGLPFFYFSLTDRKLKMFCTGQSRHQNLTTVADTLDELNWHFKTEHGIFFVDIPFIGSAIGFLMIVIVRDNTIYYNVRNTGGMRGRLPFFFGLETRKEKVFLHQMEHRTTAALQKLG